MPVIVYTAQNKAMSDSYQFGKEAEEIAKAYLVQEGYKILAKIILFKKPKLISLLKKEIWLSLLKLKHENTIP